MTYLNYGLFVLLMLSQNVMIAQGDTIHIKNGSFEGVAQRGLDSFALKNWFDCGQVEFRANTPPDVHPKNLWGVVQKAHEGKTYLGLVTRDDETWESISQRLDQALEAGACYSFRIALSQDENYKSPTRMSTEKLSFTNPTVLRMYLGNGYCEDNNLVFTSESIDHNDWVEYEFSFRAEEAYRYIKIEAFYKLPIMTPANGHILLDAMSDFEKIQCN